MNPLVPGLALAACLLMTAVGMSMLRSVPAGAQRLMPSSLDAAEGQRSLLKRLQDALGRRFGRTVLAGMSTKRKDLIRHRLDAAGHPGGLSLEGYAGVKAASTILFAFVGFLTFLFTNSILFVVIFALVGWMQTDLTLVGQAKRRQARIDRDMPDFLDVLAITVGAGLGFRSALQRVGEELGGPLGQEVRIALQQMGYGAARRGALQGIKDRNDAESLDQFITALLQAEELGAPLTETLRDISEDMRSSFHQRARRDAARAVPRVSLVVTLVVVPGLIVMVLAALYIGSGVDLSGLGG